MDTDDVIVSLNGVHITRDDLAVTCATLSVIAKLGHMQAQITLDKLLTILSVAGYDIPEEVTAL